MHGTPNHKDLTFLRDMYLAQVKTRAELLKIVAPIAAQAVVWPLATLTLLGRGRDRGQSVAADPLFATSKEKSAPTAEGRA
jgi:hypothetical protein